MHARRSTDAVAKAALVQRRLVSYHPAPFGIKSGPGGRSSNSGITATVFGAYGFVGRYFVDELGKRGSRVYIPYRGCEMEIRHLKPMFDLGQLGLMPFSPRDRESICEAVKKSDVVINMIGKHYETKHIVPTRRADGNLSRVNYDFEEVNVTIPRILAEISKEAGVESFIHVSALSADLESKSKWSRTKAQGELAVREAFPEAIIVKPATIFGPEDRFLNWIAETTSRLPFFPLIENGQTLVQPISATDVGKALMAIVDRHDEFEGKTFQLVGPAEYSFKEVAEYVSDVTSVKKHLINVPTPLAAKVGSFVEQLVQPVLTEDHIAQLREDVLPQQDKGYLGMQDLDLTPVSMDRVAFEFLHRFRPGGHFQLVKGYH
uniref:NAD-dependent epimerase/dehydratase domain-containing protein n=1 Tax=Spumella elongata TaxID=89044 RepID=A0A7S3HC55_9STRA|mmetsp:Transcript_44395/g.77466  ORF Transcript_44395/g.77466 Transcript_44395/m.77466 type:complete len:376 (+) Transcript_44395:27-1154(+)|eukprot:CAMPEP_0184971110 /NCGR_PEP_ID=MMETSP1098-20130426/3400_1 /TAXON_ID=89044 /ORGANISM="Spumella elongata, Strain CCAP 955/1" /LENGTH=375 /DNA_ID=CAMNT_0027493161 /DNA_START=27 /DNA_END=1154 /DNA_ORIENTATION=-